MADGEPPALSRPDIPVTWREPVPPEVQTAIVPYLDRYATLFPGWIEELSVAYEPDRDASMATSINYRNRWVILRVTGEWLMLPQRERDVAVLHEITHVLLAPLQNVTEEIKKSFLKEDAFAREMVDDGFESVCEDVARAIQRVCFMFSGLK